MEWNTETQRHRALFFERTEFTELFISPCLCASVFNIEEKLFYKESKEYEAK